MKTVSFIYVLECISSNPMMSPCCYYVGKTEHPETRLYQHFHGEGSAWTKKHKPTRVLDIFKEVTIHDEDNITKTLMIEKGIANVRGGSYTAIEFDEITLSELKRAILTAKGECYICSLTGHVAKDCKEGDKQATVATVDVMKDRFSNKWSKEDEINFERSQMER